MASEGGGEGALPDLLCRNGHPVVKLRENLTTQQRIVHWRATKCELCGTNIGVKEPRWKCDQHCHYNVCNACAEHHWEAVFHRASTSSSDRQSRWRLLQSVPQQLRGTSGYARLAQTVEDRVPQALGLLLRQAWNVPDSRAFAAVQRQPRVRTALSMLGTTGAGTLIAGPVGAAAGFAVGAAACGVSSRVRQPAPLGDCDPVVVVEVLDEDGECLAAARSHIALKSRDPVWDQVLSLPSGSEGNSAAWARLCHLNHASKTAKLASAREVPPAYWAVESTSVRLTLYDKSLHLNPTIGECTIKLPDLLQSPDAKWLLSDAGGDAALSSVSPHMPCEVAVSVVEESVPASWPRPPERPKAEADAYPHHVFMMTRGTRGDVQPFVALARGMAEQLGWMVTICTELKQKDFVKKHSQVSRGRIRFRPSGGDTEARMQGLGAKVLLGTKTELLQMAALSRSEAEFFTSATVFVHHVQELDKEAKPVDLIVFGFTLCGIAALVSEHCRKPAVGFMLQPSIIPSKDSGWTAVQAVYGPHGKSLVDMLEEAAFTSHESFQVLKGFAEHNPFARWNLDAMRRLFNLEPANTWTVFTQLRVPLVVPMPEGTFERPSDWWEEIRQTDFIFLRNTSQGGCGNPGDAGVAAFISAAHEAGAGVCLMTFSSMPVPRRTVLQCAVRMVEECSHNLRLILVGPSAEGPRELEARAAALAAEGRFMEVERADFGVVFPQVDCFVVHGGLGTTVEALRTRKPCCVTGPLLFDQRFWGGVCAQKGVGPEPVHIDDFEASCVAFANGALDPADPNGWQQSAKKHDWGHESNDGVRANVECFAQLVAEGLEPITAPSERHGWFNPSRLGRRVSTLVHSLSGEHDAGSEVELAQTQASLRRSLSGSSQGW